MGCGCNASLREPLKTACFDVTPCDTVRNIQGFVMHDSVPSLFIVTYVKCARRKWLGKRLDVPGCCLG